MNKTMVLVAGTDATSVLNCVDKLIGSGLYAATGAVSMELAISKFQQGSYQAVVFAGENQGASSVLRKIFSFQQPELVVVDDEPDVIGKIAAGLTRRCVLLDNAMELIGKA